jgi:prepilin peptidase CpaA
MFFQDRHLNAEHASKTCSFVVNSRPSDGNRLVTGTFAIIFNRLDHRGWYMAFSPTLSHVVLVITAAVLFYAALTDLRHFKIGNELILVLIGLFIVHALLSGRWVSAHWNLAFAAFMFVIMVYFYSQNLMGGGDVKILAVAFLWTGIWCAFVFAVLMAIFAMVQVAAAKFGWLKVQKVGEQKRIPLAPSVAGALIICFMLGCLQPL